MIFFSCQKKAYFWSKSDIYSKIDVQINLTGSEREKNDTDLCKSLGFNHTNAEIHIPRAPRDEEREILDEIFKDSKHFSEFKSCAKMILIFFKIEEKSSPGSNFEKKNWCMRLLES